MIMRNSKLKTIFMNYFNLMISNSLHPPSLPSSLHPSLPPSLHPFLPPSLSSSLHSSDPSFVSLFPSFPLSIPPSSYIKLSDYGISQFASTHGAKGLVGTPGFIAPEILKYHGKEAYSERVDIFSFAMMVYELITKHMPFQNLTPNQANQANENGARPTLKKKVMII